MTKCRPAAPPTTPTSSRRPFHESIMIAIKYAIQLGSSTLIIEHCRLLNRTSIPREHLRPMATELRAFATPDQCGHHALIEAAALLDAEHELLVR